MLAVGLRVGGQGWGARQGGEATEALVTGVRLCASLSAEGRLGPDQASWDWAIISSQRLCRRAGHPHHAKEVRLGQARDQMWSHRQEPSCSSSSQVCHLLSFSSWEAQSY